MYSQLMGFLNRFNQIYTRKFGFHKAHSTINTLINIVERVRECLHKGEFACGVFVDLQKAFDTVDHEILHAKLEHHGIRGVANDKFKSYPSNCSQFVTILNSKSKRKLLKHGLP